MDDRTHASWFSGVGGLDLGLERAGWRTVSFSEIDPYASAVLAERWPGIPNLGDITDIARGGSGERSGEQLRQHADGVRPNGRSTRAGRTIEGRVAAVEDRDGAGDRLVASGAHAAYLWTGGFPCQDLSVAGKRRGMVEGTRSNLAFAFLDLVERHRPPAILLENVPGLLSSHGGRDMAVLTGRMAELGYGVAYRILDARHFGVPQRRRRVFILGLRSGPDDPTGRVAAERAAAILAVGTRCDRHPATGGEAGSGAADGVGVSAAEPEYLRQSINAKWSKGYSGPAGDEHHNLTLVSPSPDAGGVRAPDGLAGRLDDRLMGSLREHVGPGSNTDYTVVQEQAATLNSGGNDGGFRTEPGEHLVTVRRATRARSADDADRWEVTDEAGALNGWDLRHGEGNELAIGTGMTDDPLLPLGLDSHRYRCCGNGVVANVAEWLGVRLLSTGTVPE